MWIKTQETDTHRAMLVNMNRIDAVGVEDRYGGGFSVDAIGQLTSNEDVANIVTLFEGTQEDCQACLDWIYSQLDWNNAVGDINVWWHNRQPVDPGKFSEIAGEVVEKDDIPF